MKVVLDACVLYPFFLRDLLLRLGEAGALEPRWSRAILDECFDNLAEGEPKERRKAFARTRALMEASFPEALVEGYEARMAGLTLPDPGDVHVLAAAIEAGAELIVTSNLKHFPLATCRGHGVGVAHPDAFLTELVDDHPEEVLRVFREMVAALKHPPVPVAEALQRLERSGLPRSAAAFVRLLEP